MKIIVVYPPMDRKEMKGVAMVASLEAIAPYMTRDAGFRAYEVTIPDNEAINKGLGFTAESSPRELLEEWDRVRPHVSETEQTRILDNGGF